MSSSAALSSRSIMTKRRRKWSKEVVIKALVALLVFVFTCYIIVMLALVHETPQINPIIMNAADAADSAEAGKLHPVMTYDRLVDTTTTINDQKSPGSPPSQPSTLRAFLEPIQQSDWNIQPLPIRTTTAKDLTQIDFHQYQKCSKLTEQWPVDNYPDADPFLPWIHDVFPNDDGTELQFVAQNKRRCHTGTKPQDIDILKQTQPQVALFQGVSVKRIINANDEDRFMLTDHEHADPDGMDTRFICRFKPSNQITLSQHNINYDYAAFRKGQPHTFTEPGHDLKSIHTSQLVFFCPIPINLQHIIKTGISIHNDEASLFVDLVPIRTPPRYNRTNAYFPPRYKQFQDQVFPFDPKVAWGDAHLLPRINDSGRWENIPICLPSPLAFPIQQDKNIKSPPSTTISISNQNNKTHRLVACVWASSGYTTRGDRFAIHDGQRRLREWIHFNQLVGFDHFYIYDNSPLGGNTLQTVTNDYPNITTHIVWPSKICNNNKNFHDSAGERSSQYAAESSCRLRFGPSVEWIGQFDIDEYLVPMGNFTKVTQLLDKLDQEGNKIISFASWRAWPRRELIVPPVPIKDDPKQCGESRACFHCMVPPNRTILQTYNCDRFYGQKQKSMPAEKQLYRPDYVLQHFVHYSTVTKLSIMNEQETVAAGQPWREYIHVDPLSRFSDETLEGTMLHTKAMATQDTAGWLQSCKGHTQRGVCRIGNPWPQSLIGESKNPTNVTMDEDGWLYNCYINTKIDDYFVPLLEQSLMNQIGGLS